MMNEVFGYAVWFVQGCLVVAMLNSTARLFVGPAAQDRVLAFDALYLNGMLLLLVLGLTVASAAFHEIGHAAACRYGGGRPGGMGAGIDIQELIRLFQLKRSLRIGSRSRATSKPVLRRSAALSQ